jgi:hypothetical protein
MSTLILGDLFMASGNDGQDRKAKFILGHGQKKKQGCGPAFPSIFKNKNQAMHVP